MAEDNLPAIESCGFVRVPSDPEAAKGTPLWLTCDACSKSDNFWVTEGLVRCRCGAKYDHAARPDGRNIPVSDLTFVPWNEGPMSLADTELDPIRLTLVIALALAALGGLGVLVWWLVTSGVLGV